MHAPKSHITMQSPHRPIALAIALLLGACGGGGGSSADAGKAVSSSPEAPGVGIQAPAPVAPVPPSNGTNTPSTPSTPETSAPSATPTDQSSSTRPTTGNNTGTGTDDTQQGGKGTGPGTTAETDTGSEISQPPVHPLLLNGQLSGQAIITMLESKAPVYTIWVPQRAPAFHPLPNTMHPVASRHGEDLPYLDQAAYPAVEASSGISPDNYVQISPTEVYHGTSSRYQPAKGDFMLTVRTDIPYAYCLSCQSTKLFINMSMTVKGHAGENDFTLDEEMKIDTVQGWPMVQESENLWPPYKRTFTLVSTQAQTYSRAAYFPADLPIQTWRAGAGTANLFWRPGSGPRDVDLCWDIKTDFDVNRLTCTTWTLQEDWKHGMRFTGGGMYMEDDRSALNNGETGKFFYRVDPKSIDLLHG